MNNYAPFVQRQVDYLHRCLNSWFNVAEGGKRGGKKQCPENQNTSIPIKPSKTSMLPFPIPITIFFV